MDIEDIKINNVYTISSKYISGHSKHLLLAGDSIKVVGKYKKFNTVIAIPTKSDTEAWEVDANDIEDCDINNNSMYCKIRNMDLGTMAVTFKKMFGCSACAYHNNPKLCRIDDRCTYGFIEFLKGKYDMKKAISSSMEGYK